MNQFPESREEEWTEDLSTTDTWRSSRVPLPPNFPLRVKVSHKVGGLEGHYVCHRVKVRGGICSQVTPLAPKDWRGTSRTWAPKQVKRGAPTTSIISCGKSETKLEISIKVSQLRGLTLKDLGRGHFQWEPNKSDSVTVIFGVLWTEGIALDLFKDFKYFTAT